MCARVRGLTSPQKTHGLPLATTRYPLTMAKRDSDTQTTPTGTTIPVPKRGEFDANLDKLLKAPQPPKKVQGRRVAPRGERQS